MAPVGTAFRRNGEQVIVHQCLGCGELRYCRAAADDHPLVCMRLPLIDSLAQIELSTSDAEAIA